MALPWASRLPVSSTIRRFSRSNIFRLTVLVPQAPVSAHVALGLDLPGLVEAREPEDLDAFLLRPAAGVDEVLDGVSPARHGAAGGGADIRPAGLADDHPLAAAGAHGAAVHLLHVEQCVLGRAALPERIAVRRYHVAGSGEAGMVLEFEIG